jgi:hypothetical protein
MLGCELVRCFAGLGFLGMAKTESHCCYACESSFAMVEHQARKSAVTYQKDHCGSYAMLVQCYRCMNQIVVPVAATKRLYTSLRRERAGSRAHSRWWRRIDSIVPYRVPLFEVLFVVPIVLARALTTARDLVLAMLNHV